MKRTILSIIVVTAISFSGYHFMQSDKENLKPIKEPDNFNNLNAKNVDQSKEELKQDDFDYHLNMAKTHENGYRNGQCHVFGSPCMMERVKLSNKKLEKHKAAIARADKESEKRRLIADAEIKEIQEAERLRLEYEANRNFEKEISKYTPIVYQVLTFENVEELKLEDTGFEDFIDDYDLSYFEDVSLFEKVNHRVFKVANSDSYKKFFSDVKDRELLSGITFPHIDDKDSYSMKKLNCKEEEGGALNQRTGFKCDTHNLLVRMRNLDNGYVEFTIRYNEMYPHKSYVQKIIINKKGEMLVLDPYRDGSGNIRKNKRKIYAID